MQYLQNLNSRTIIWLLVLWQVISVYLVSIGVWPSSVVYISVVLCAIFIVIFDSFESSLLLVVSLPFYVIVSNPYFETLTSLRVLYAWLFVVFLIKNYKSFWLKWRETFFVWDAYIVAFLLLAGFSGLFARFSIQSIKQTLFLVNLYLLYVVVSHSLKTKAQIISLVKYSAISTGIIVLLGYVQFAATFFTTPYYFWQYWSLLISKAYYGLGLSNILAYSNSWFSYQGDTQSLRMFSIMPDSHSFGLVAVFAIAFLLPFVYLYPSLWRQGKSWREILTSKNMYVWDLVRFSGLAIILSGTRGLWVGMLPAMGLSVAAYFANVMRPVMRKLLLSFLMIILFFAASPLINQGLNWLRVSSFEENFLDRARSIYDLEEHSNVGRLIIWRDSLKYSLIHPLGVGYGNFVVTLVKDVSSEMSFEDVASQKNLRYNLPQKFVSAHSLYLSVLVELGFAGLLILLVGICHYLVFVGKFLWKHRFDNNFYLFFIASILFTNIWIAGYSFFDVTIFNDRVFSYFLIGLALQGIIMRNYQNLVSERTPDA
jgi:hypothetical protein